MRTSLHFSSYFSNSSLLLERAKLSDILKLRLYQIPISSHRKYSETFSNYVFAKLQFHPIENILGQFQIMSLPNSNSISAKMLQDIFRLCLCQIPSPLLTYSILLTLESKQCPLMLALVLACVDSVDALRF